MAAPLGSPRPPPFRKPNVEERPQPVDKGGLLWIGAVVGIVVLIGAAAQCSPRSADNTAAFVDGNVSNAIAAQPPPPVQPLAAAAVTRGTSHLRVAVNAEGFSGAMIYSQNCYDALGRQFTWAKLDTCGAFDMLAVRSIAEADTANLANEAGYFQSEAAAGRYLAAATAAGQEAGEADTRLSDLQSRVERTALVGRRPVLVQENAVNEANDLPPMPDDLHDADPDYEP